MVYRNSHALRPETVVENLGPRFGEYPAALLTRRTWSLQSHEVIAGRETAPAAVWNDPRSYPEGRAAD